MATRWCLICGSEYIDTVDECPDCEVALVDERPDQDISGIGDGQVAYDLAEWSAESRVMLEQLLESEDIRRAWEGTTLVVPDVFETRVDNLVEHVEVTALPTLDPAAEKVAYDVGDWTDDMVNELQTILDNAEVPYEFDADGDVVTLAEHEERVEALMDAIESPGDGSGGGRGEGDGGSGAAGSGPGAASTGAEGAVGEGAVGEGAAGEESELEADDDESDDDEGDDDESDDDEGDEAIDASVVLSDLFVSSDRMMHSARDHDGVLTFVDAADRAERMQIPYGFSRIVWRDILNQVLNIRALLEDDEADDDDIEQQARDLRNTLRDYV